MLSFGNYNLFTIGGVQSEARAQALAAKMNAFFDSSPQIFSVRAEGPRLMWFGKELVSFTADDTAGKSPEEAASSALAAIKTALFNLDFRTGG